MLDNAQPNTSTSKQDPEATKLTPFMVFTLTIAVLLNVQDGFDILAIAYAADNLATDWSLARSELGIVFSASLLGMMIGAIGMGPLADRIGRRSTVAIGLFISGIGMLAASYAPNLSALIGARIVTGIGIAGVLVSMNTLVAEYAGPKYRSLAIALFQMGYPLGGFFAGFATHALLDIGGWRAIFAFGAVLSFAFIPLILILPESLSFLALSKKANALLLLNKARRKLGYSELTTIPISQSRHSHARVWDLFSKDFRAHTLMIWTAFFFLLMVVYFLMSWTPKLLIDSGFSEAKGNLAGKVINFAGLFGIILMGFAGIRFRSSAVSAFYLIGLGVAMLSFSIAGLKADNVYTWIFIMGFFLHGSLISLYSTAPSLYPPELRATGTGWALGLSRFGAVLGPIIAASLLDANWKGEDVVLLFGAPTLISAIIMTKLYTSTRDKKMH